MYELVKNIGVEGSQGKSIPNQKWVEVFGGYEIRVIRECGVNEKMVKDLWRPKL